MGQATGEVQQHLSTLPGAVQTELTANGDRWLLAEPDAVTLLEALRDRLGLTGVKYGCGEARCGACVVLLNGVPTPACVTSLRTVAGGNVTTIEGLAGGSSDQGELHPVQQAFIDTGALQCGYCTPGMTLAAVALLRGNPRPSRAEIVGALDEHLCRCGAYARIVQAVQLAAERLVQ